MAESFPIAQPDRLPRVAIVVSQYNTSLCERMLDGALEVCSAAGATGDLCRVVRVPGAWEIPLAVHWLLEQSTPATWDAIIALGVVIQGETTHDEHINRAVTLALSDLALRFATPVGLGVLTCRTLQQAVERAGGKWGNKGAEAATAALDMWRLRQTSLLP
jgi:6,7-dimethyl-8-ribityllumazine synthase